MFQAQQPYDLVCGALRANQNACAVPVLRHTALLGARATELVDRVASYGERVPGLFLVLMLRRRQLATLFPYTTLFRSQRTRPRRPVGPQRAVPRARVDAARARAAST